MDSGRRTVRVSSESTEAYADPKFVLEFDGKIYVTVGVLEYDPNDGTDDPDKTSELRELQAMLDGPRPVSGTPFGRPHETAAMAQSESKNN